MILEVHFSIPGQGEQQVLLGDHSPLKVGSLLSNQVVLPLLGVDPIHALFELKADGSWMISDLGSDTGIFLNGKKIEVEADIKAGDQLKLGSASLRITVQRGAEALTPPVPPPPPRPRGAAQTQTGQGQDTASIPPLPKNVLFSTDKDVQSGELLEVVAYWGETIVEVEHFHPSLKGFSSVTIGEDKSCHFAAATENKLRRHVLAQVQGSGYVLNLVEGMTARLRRGGKVSQVTPGKYSMALGDIADVHFGAVRYFLLFMRPTQVQLPPLANRDPFFRGLIISTMVIYLVATIGLAMIDPKAEETAANDDIWTLVHVPEKQQKPKRAIEPPVPLATVKTEPPPSKEPPAPAPKPVEAADPKEKAKPALPAPSKVRPPPSMEDNLTKVKEPASAAPAVAKPAARTNPVVGGGGRTQQAGGQRKGNDQTSMLGAENAGNKKAAGVNLSKLGLGVGKISSAKGAGAIHTKFQNSAGGAGGGTGSGKATFGLGGLDSNVKSLGLSGSSGAANRFGSGGANSLIGDGKNASGAFGDGKKAAQVNIRAGDPLVSGGLTQQEILAVIRTHLNEIRHCYEKLLQRSPSASGLIKVQFVVGLDGRVTAAQVASSTISDGSMGGCVTGVVRRWNFPNPRGGAPVTVNYPFTFNPL